MSTSRGFGLIKIIFSPYHSFPLIGWSCSFCAKLVFDVLSRANTEFKRESPKPFTLTPLYVYKDGSWRVLQSGIYRGDKCSHVVVDPSFKYSFKIAFLTRALL
ncbi:MAG: hypothetical protein DRO16_04890 [Thermoprotei archaeon]|nr:MAG: hypothetical protein DRO16_04890 [Thermoprotei archaeon]